MLTPYQKQLREYNRRPNICPRCEAKGKRDTVDNFALYKCPNCSYKWGRHIKG